MSEEQYSLIIDPGSANIRFGTPENSLPSLKVPSLIGRPKHIPHAVFKDQEFICHVGEQLHEFPYRYDEFKPIISNGIVQDWDDMIILLENCLPQVPNFEMGDGNKTKRVLLTEHLMNPWKNRERWHEVMFEYFDFDSMMLQSQPLTALFATGRSTGIVLDIGDNCTQILPIFDGYALKNLMSKVRLGGSDLTKFIANQLSRVGLKNHKWEDDLSFVSGWEFTNSGMEISKQIKEQTCYIATDFMKEMQVTKTSNLLSKTYELPDKSTITIDELRFKCGEVLFRPSDLLGVDYADGGVDDLLINTLLKSPIDCKADFYKNILIAGGSTLMKGLKDRLHFELKSRLFPQVLNHELSPKITIVEDTHRMELSWIGGAILGSLGLMTHYQFSKEAYLESGCHHIFRPYSLNFD